MTQAPPSSSLNGSRLVRILSELVEPAVDLSHQQFSEQLGRLIDFSDSIELSTVQGELLTLVYTPSGGSAEAVKDEFLRVRSLLLQTVVKSFAPGGSPLRMKLPVPANDVPTEVAMSFAPYHRFYAAHQREFEVSVLQLQSEVQDAVSGLSADLARLAALDRVLNSTLLPHARKYFPVIPRLLAKRFEYLLAVHQQAISQQGGDLKDDPSLWMQPSGWLNAFCSEMKDVLLAELEVRLMPVLGLVEAVNEHIVKNARSLTIEKKTTKT